MSDVAKKVISIITRIVDTDEGRVTPVYLLQTNLRNEIGMDNLFIYDLIFELKIEFDIDITNDDVRKMHTVGDVVAYVEKVLNKDDG